MLPSAPTADSKCMRPVIGRPHDTSFQLTNTYLFLNIKWNKFRLCHLITCLCLLYTVSSSGEPCLGVNPLGNEALPATSMTMYLTAHTSTSGTTIIMYLPFWFVCFWVHKQQNQMHIIKLIKNVSLHTNVSTCIFFFSYCHNFFGHLAQWVDRYWNDLILVQSEGTF